MPSATVKVSVPQAPASGVRLRVVQDERPKTRGECIDGPRPCPWTTCEHHLAPMVAAFGKRSGDIQGALARMRETCTLDVADRGGLSLEAIGEALGGVTRETMRKIQDDGLRKLAIRAPGLRDAVDTTPERSAI